ncbi:MAG TPA: Gfo/Idh/MocA family oxidoreductase [Burkholderiales bacterium]|jgi:predicted dehydrogenase|nr:Gfo/Idh/MocA family oxidoreductase [Burkholderiales bacterium]
MVRAAIVGLGWWGKTVVDAVQGKSDKITFVAGCTRTRSKAEDFCRERNIELRDDLDAVLNDKNVEAVVFTTPHSQHEEHIRRAAQARKHVCVEKPFTLTAKSAKAALSAVKKARVVIAVDFQRRFHPSVIEMNRRVKDGSLGTLTFCVGEVSTPSGLALAKESWRVNPEETPAGAMTGLGIHLVDGFIDLCGEVEEVYCVNARRAAPLVDDTTLFTMKHKSGVISTSQCTMASGASYCMAAFGTQGIAETVRPGLDTFRFLPAGATAHGPGAQPEVIENKGFNPVKAVMEAFAAAIRKEAPFPVTPGQILHGVKVFEAIVKSAQTGKPVKVK